VVVVKMLLRRLQGDYNIKKLPKTTGISTLRFPQSNAPKLRWQGQRKTIWDGQAIEMDKYGLQDSPSDSEFLGVDEDDEDDYSDDSMELPPHPPVSKEVHDTFEETINQLSSSVSKPTWGVRRIW
jgi:hypothetical protein